MAISKRLRFEILRRDGFRCTYCRRSEVILTVDHITPVSLGGTDHPSNLVAACDDCNTGKASTSIPLESAAGTDRDEVVISAAVIVWSDHWMPNHQREPDAQLLSTVRAMARRLYPIEISAWQLLRGAEASGEASGATPREVWDLAEACETDCTHEAWSGK